MIDDVVDKVRKAGGTVTEESVPLHADGEQKHFTLRGIISATSYFWDILEAM